MRLRRAGCLDPLPHRDQRVDHRVADVVDPGRRAAFGEQVVARLGRVDEQELGELVGDDAVDLLGHRPVERAQARLDVSDRDEQLRGGERGGQRRVHVPGHEHDVRLRLEQHRLEPLHDRGGLLRVRSRADPERVVGVADAELLEEDLGHLAVVVLARVDEHVLELIAPPAAAPRRSARSSSCSAGCRRPRALCGARPCSQDSAGGGLRARYAHLRETGRFAGRRRPRSSRFPSLRRAPGSVLVANAASAISSGTERSVVALRRRARSPRGRSRTPNLVAQTLQHAREHGVRETIGAVARRGRAGQPPSATRARAPSSTPAAIAGLHVGQRVACAGAGRANHAEVVSVPPNLVVPVPEGVSLRDAVVRGDRRDRAPGSATRRAVARRARGRRRAGPARADHRAGCFGRPAAAWPASSRSRSAASSRASSAPSSR